MSSETKPENNQSPASSSGAPSSNASAQNKSQAAATNIIRQQIDQIYDVDPPHKDAASGNAQTANDTPPQGSVYKRTHNDRSAYSHVAKQWQQYHSSWQNYYQQYYQRYYLHQLGKSQPQSKSIDSIEATPVTDNDTGAIGSGYENETSANDLREQVLNKVKKQAETAKKSRHFMPVITALAVILVFVFLQFNQLFFAQVHAYVSPGSISAQNIVVDPNAGTAVGPAPKIIIPKINVEAPVIYGLKSLADSQVQESLKSGVVNYPIPGASSVPGQAGNTVILGHSSNDIFNNGNYKFIFVQLDKLQKGDTIYVNYKGTRYTYKVVNKKVVKPEQVSALAIKTSRPLLTLVTCTPAGTALNRLLVTAQQISPNPAKARQPTQSGSSTNSLAGNSPTLLEQIFGN